MKELKETISMMTSDDFKERLKAEYYQTKIRYEKLKKIVTKMDAADMAARNGIMYNGLPFTPKCPSHLLSSQANLMRDYINVLELRAELEGIEL